jgi:tRNA(fMet)-specific endonuclease VapC
MYALDTNTVSYYFRGDGHVVDHLRRLSPTDVGIPAIVAYELRYGLLRLPEDAAASRLDALNVFLTSLTTFDFDRGCATHAAHLRVSLEAAGTPIGPHDTLIAATALRYGATLITRNIREFARVPGLLWENWYDAA